MQFCTHVCAPGVTSNTLIHGGAHLGTVSTACSGHTAHFVYENALAPNIPSLVEPLPTYEGRGTSDL